jgi:hypothetical protein
MTPIASAASRSTATRILEGDHATLASDGRIRQAYLGM